MSKEFNLNFPSCAYGFASHKELFSGGANLLSQKLISGPSHPSVAGYNK